MDEQYKEQAYRLANIGYWELNVVDEELYWSDQVKRLHEVPKDYNPDLAEALAFYPEGEHRQSVQSALDETIREGTSFSVESKIITAEGNTRWIKAIGEAVVKGGRCVCVFGTTQDITDQRETEERAQRVNQELQDIVNHSTIMFYRHDTGHKLTYVSPQSKYFLGCTPEQAKKKWMAFVTDHPQNKKGMQAAEKAIETGVPQPPYELQIERTDGKFIWVQVNESPVVKNGETVEIVGSLTDITSLKEKEAQLRNIANNIDGMVHRYIMHPDSSYEFTFASEGVKDLHEVTPQQAIKSPDLLWSQIIDDHVESVRQSVQQSAEQLTLWDHKWEIETPSGQRKWIHGKGTPKQLEDGSVQWDTILIDITNQHQLEQSISRQVALQNQILDTLPGIFFIIDTDSTFVRTNQNVEDLFGKTATQLQSTSILEYISPGSLDEAKEAIRKVITEGYYEHETILLDGQGRERHYYMCGSSFKIDDKLLVIGNGIDITDRVKVEEENTVLLQEVHHRVKNNLAIISGILTLELYELPQASGNRIPLERSVNRIQSIAKVHELLYQSNSFSKININKYITELVETVTSTLQVGDNIDIRLDIAEVEMNINDIIPLGMLLNELLTNSLKYAFRGQETERITLNITQYQEAYHVRYQDNGKGFDRNVFEDSVSLGLTIVNLLLQQLEADYEFDTSEGFELDFTFECRETGSHANL